MEIHVVIEGRNSLMLNRFPDEDGITPGGASKQVYAGKATPEEECEKKLYLMDNGKPYIPASMMLACIREGGRYHKIGREKVTTRDRSLVPAFVEIEPMCIKIISDGGWSVDSRPVCNQATKGRFMAHRPIFHDWKLEFTIELDEEMATELLYDIIVSAGKRCGLGTFTPRCKGPFGRFNVTAYKKKRKRSIIDKKAS